MAERFYVYRFADADGPLYIGKGSGRRIKVQSQRFGFPGEIIGEYKSECKAYEAECAAIKAECPRLNKHPGGNGCRAQKRIARKDKWERNFEAIGSRRYAAQLLMQCAPLVDASKREAIRQVAYG